MNIRYPIYEGVYRILTIYIAVGNSLITNFVTKKRSELCVVHSRYYFT